MGIADQRKDSLDAEQSVLCRSVCIRQDRGTNRIEDGRARQSSRYRKPRNEWKVSLLGHHPGYITWEEYLENQKHLEANVAWSVSEGSGAAKLGVATPLRDFTSRCD